MLTIHILCICIVNYTVDFSEDLNLQSRARKSGSSLSLSVSLTGVKNIHIAQGTLQGEGHLHCWEQCSWRTAVITR